MITDCAAALDGHLTSGTAEEPLPGENAPAK